MTTKRIAGAVTTTVTLGAAPYGATLTVTASGSVTPLQYGATAILAPASVVGPVIHNFGTLQGGAGAVSAAGGIGVDLAAHGTVHNAGTIEAGRGGDGYHAGNGATAIIFEAGGAFSNTGTIVGGGGGYSYSNYNYAGNGGAGVLLGTGTQAVNEGTVSGGNGGQVYGATDGGFFGFCGIGGVGIQLDASTLTNKGTITGGNGGNSHQIFGIVGYYNSIGGSGGDGVDLTSATTLVNKGAIVGGHGGDTGYIVHYERAGFGVDVIAGGFVSNSGTILGGYAGNATGATMPGGVGVDLAAGGTLTNSGTIIGGAGGFSYRYASSQGGAGVYLNGGTLITSGKISGGVGGSGGGARGDAVQFGGTSATLVVKAGAIFHGDIAANASARDVLQLAGETPGTLAGFGTHITGFATIDERSAGNWTLTGTIAGVQTIEVGTGGTLALQDAVAAKTILFDKGGSETLALGAPAQVTGTFTGFRTGDTIQLAGLQATSLTYQAGSLTLYDANNQPLDTLIFAGDYSQAGFNVQVQGNETDLTYAGTLPDHAPTWLALAAQPEARLFQAGSIAHFPEPAPDSVLALLATHHAAL